MQKRLLQFTKHCCNSRLSLFFISITLVFLINCNNIKKVFGLDRDADATGTEALIMSALLVTGTSGKRDSGPEAIIMFSTEFEVNGDMNGSGGRSGADNLCLTAKNSRNLSCSAANTHAFLSIDGIDDYVGNFPAKFGTPASVPITGPTGIKIADDWADLLDGSIDESLTNTGVDYGWDGYFHSGSHADGTIATDNCSGYTSISSSEYTTVMDVTQTNAAWLYYPFGPACNNIKNYGGILVAIEVRLICVCW